MNLALIVPGGVDRSGTQRVIPALLWLIERLARAHRVHVIALNPYDATGTYPLLGATVHNIGRAPRLKRTRSVLNTLQGLGPLDAIHGFWAAPCGLLAAIFGRILHVPSLVSLCGGELTALRDIGYGSQLRLTSRLQVALALRLKNQVTASSRYMIELARQHGHAAVEVPLGVPASYFGSHTTPDLHTQPPWRLLYVASLNRVKDPFALMRALGHIVAAEPQVQLDVVGEDTLGGEVQRFAEALDVAGYITFHGFKPAHETLPLYQHAHILLLPSRHDAAPVVMLEAAACGVPTVGTAVGYTADWQPDRAVAVSVGDDEALARETLALLRDTPRRIAIGHAAQDWARRHDADWTARTFEGLYQGLTTKAAGQSNVNCQTSGE